MVGVLTVLAALILAVLPRFKPRASRIACANNLKQIGLSFRLFATDNADHYPMQVPVLEGGTMELVSSGQVFPHFLAMSNELGTPRILLCPRDKQRTNATKWSGLSDSNVSYFVGLDGEETEPSRWLSGDRNFTNRLAPGNRFLELTTNSVLGWSKEMHRQAGNVVLCDGSVRQFSNSTLRAAIQAMGPGTNRLVIP